MSVRYSIRHRRGIAETRPAVSQIYPDSSEQVDFRR
ncbi:Cytosine deaminase [Erwinia amylovora Ea644]|nr:Cytosine deaminase [Erwinia amylovora Ea644]CCP08770.1 hypothetical protein BN440_3783 [Erwinia amylovora MR1]